MPEPLAPTLLPPSAPPVVLVVDDDVGVARAVGRIVERAGYKARLADRASAVLEHLETAEVDAIVTDLQMPGMDGLELLRELRRRGRDLPVIVLTGEPSLESAMRAVELGAYRYFTKPFQAEPLMDAIRDAVSLGRLARVSREARELVDRAIAGEKTTQLEDAFTSAIDRLWMAFQPIVTSETRGIFAYEALMRSREPRLPHPGAILEAAEKLQRVHVLGRATRALTAAELDRLPPNVLCFVNLHALDLTDPELFLPASPLARHAKRIVLELTERASAESIGDLRERIARLRELGYRLAIDDVGAGYGGLQYFARVAPEFAKIDMSIVRGIDGDPVRQRIVLSLVQMCRDLGIEVVAEGIETEPERDTAVRLGCDALQGYRFGKPAEPFAIPGW